MKIDILGTIYTIEKQTYILKKNMEEFVNIEKEKLK